jgi:hypothetical protein
VRSSAGTTATGAAARRRWSLLSRLDGEAELIEYRERYAAMSGYRVPLDHLRRSNVYGLRRRGVLVGGVVMATDRPLRTLARIPEERRPEVAGLLPDGDVVELTCLWLAPELRHGGRSALLWAGLFLELGRQGSAAALFGTEAPGLQRLYRAGRPDVVYEGPVVVDGIERYGWVFLGSVAERWSALYRVVWHKSLRGVRRRAPRGPAVLPRVSPAGSTAGSGR